MHVRIQGWIRYEIQVYMNGREWLARQLDRRQIGYIRHDNALVKIDNLEVAWELCERFAHRSWPRVLNAFARLLNPILPAIRAARYGGYYWVLDQAEIATDVMFKTRPELLAIWPDLVRHAALNLSSEDVLGFLGHKLHPSLAAEVVTDAKHRPEGWRIRHRIAGNWVKAYDKASVLRVETVINNPREFRILRVVTDAQGRRERRWCEMRKGVSDLWRSFQVGIGANQRYLEALAAAPLQGKASPHWTPCAGPIRADCCARCPEGCSNHRGDDSTPIGRSEARRCSTRSAARSSAGAGSARPVSSSLCG
jgi:hypothetical protein